MDDKELAFDLTSQVFLKAIKNIQKYEYRGVPFASWLYRIAKSELYQSFRDNKSRRTVNLESHHLFDLVEEFDDKEEKELRKKVLLESISEMKEDDVQIIEMRFFEKRSFKEIGEILDITENNAKVKSYRIVEKLRKIYNKKENNYIGHGKTQG
jgi:RNA polymerase sigma-70 factor (ECF subfamily)